MGDVTPRSGGDDPDWEARAIVAEAALAQIKDMWSESRWLQFSMCALHQIRDRMLGVIEGWERGLVNEHHTAESLRAAALAELSDDPFGCSRCGGRFKTATAEQYHLCVLPPAVEQSGG